MRLLVPGKVVTRFPPGQAARLADEPIGVMPAGSSDRKVGAAQREPTGGAIDRYSKRCPNSRTETLQVLGAMAGGTAVGCIHTRKGVVMAEMPENTGQIKTLTVDQVHDLWLWSEELVCLDGLTTLSVEVAEALVKSTNDLSLNGLTTLSEHVAKALAKHEGALSLNGLTTLSGEVAEALSQHKDWLYFDGLATLTREAAEALANHNDRLSLDGLNTIPDEVVEALAKHKGALSLDGLTTLSGGAAKVLAKHKGSLSLSGISALSVEAAQALQANPLILLPEKFRLPEAGS